MRNYWLTLAQSRLLDTQVGRIHLVQYYFTLFIFPGGHFVPATGEDKKVFVNFLMKMQSELAML